MTKKLRPFFSYFGAKWRMAPKYPAPRYDTVIESFAGSAGYALRHHEKRVVLCEANPALAGLWRWLIRVSADDVRRLPLLSIDQSVDALGVRPEAATMIGLWCSKGTAQANHRLSAWAKKWPRQFWGPEMRERVASQVDAIRHWTVLDDYREARNVSSTWFVDPPYEKQGRHYPTRFTDYAALRAWCESRRGQTIVCEARGASWGPFVPLAEARALRGTHHEAVWIQESES